MTKLEGAPTDADQQETDLSYVHRATAELLVADVEFCDITWAATESPRPGAEDARHHAVACCCAQDRRDPLEIEAPYS
jgi:hypothetical protein